MFYQIPVVILIYDIGQTKYSNTSEKVVPLIQKAVKTSVGTLT
jgi:hypothetical protein